MSSTNRGSERNEKDYYVTPREVVDKAMRFIFPDGVEGRSVLDPAAGGNPGSFSMAEYPCVYADWFSSHGAHVDSIDIRQDSPASIHADFLTWESPHPYEIVATNPPFSLAEEFIRKSMSVLSDGGCCVMLERLNFLCSEKRRHLFEEFKPSLIVVHRKRMSFLGNMKFLKQQTDSIEYAHFVWIKGENPDFAKTFVI